MSTYVGPSASTEEQRIEQAKQEGLLRQRAGWFAEDGWREERDRYVDGLVQDYNNEW